MKKLTKLQYEVIFLYSKGLTFKEIDIILITASRGVYSQVVVKDKGRVTRAKISREINLNNYKQELKKKLDEVKTYNKHLKNSTQYSKEKYTISLQALKVSYRQYYINDSLSKAYKSYSKYKLTFLRNHLEKVA